MPLVRTSDRDTITLTNFSFADGEVTLIHPLHAPYQTLSNLLHSTEGLEEYVEFSMSEGVTSLEDYVLLMQMTTEEAFEFAAMLDPYVKSLPAPGVAGGDIAPKILSDSDEAILSDFIRSMGGMPDAADPFASDDDEGEDGDDGLASV